MTYFSAASSLYNRGFNVLPVGDDKIPLGKSWQQWQQQRQTPKDLDTLFSQQHIHGLCVVMGGAGSDIRCFDIDKCTDIQVVHAILRAMDLPQDYPWTAQSGSGCGFHIYFYCADLDGTNPVNNSTTGTVNGYPNEEHSDSFHHIELRWHKCITVLPPSKHSTGGQYKFLFTESILPDTELATLTYEQVKRGFCAVATLTKNTPTTAEVVQPTQSTSNSALEQSCKRIRQAVEGERNNTLYKETCSIARRIGTSNFDEEHICRELTEAALAAGLTPEEIPATIQSAFKAVQGAQQDCTIQRVSSAESNPHESEKNEQPLTFWNFSENHKGKQSVQIDLDALFNKVLPANGFGKYYASDKNSLFVRTQSNIVAEYSGEQIRDFINTYVQRYNFACETDRKEVSNLLFKDRHIFTGNSLLNLSALEVQFLSDTQSTAYFQFQNCWVSVEGQGISYHPYSDLPRAVWKENVKSHNFSVITDVLEDESNVFLRFMRCVCTDRTTGELHEDRFDALVTGIGYMLHEYKKPSEAKAVVLYDELTDDTEQMNDIRSGRTGKSILANAIKQMRTTVTITKPKIDVNGRFAMQNVSATTRVVVFDDIAPDFDFATLFAFITEGIEIEKKYQDARYLSFRDAPKILITSNFPVNGTGDSFQARRHEVELCRFFNLRHTPREEFGHEFFEEWDAAEWNKFYNLMLYCVQTYLRIGLQAYTSTILHRQRIINETSKEIVEFLEGCLPDIMTRGEWVDKHDLYDGFCTTYQRINMAQKDFTKLVKNYCSLSQIRYQEMDKYVGERKHKYIRFV